MTLLTLGKINTVILVIALFIDFSIAQIKNIPTRHDLRITGGACRIPGEDGCKGIDTRGQSNPMLFHKLGRTIPELKRNHWRQFYVGQRCDHGGRFNGYQWIDPRQPPSVILLFDVQGTVAGMQFWVPYRDTKMPGQNYQYYKQPMIQNATIFGFEYFYVTVYFMKPDLICTTGRPSTALDQEGTISKFYVQNGPTPSHSKRLPLTRAAALREGWAPNNCFPGMGWHSFYDQNKWDSDGCSTFQPLVIFFDHSGDSIGFAFFTIGRATAPFLETPSFWMTEWIAGRANSTDSTPKCLRKVQNAFGISGLHVYLTERPYEFSCNDPSKPFYDTSERINFSYNFLLSVRKKARIHNITHRHVVRNLTRRHAKSYLTFSPDGKNFAIFERSYFLGFNALPLALSTYALVIKVLK